MLKIVCFTITALGNCVKNNFQLTISAYHFVMARTAASIQAEIDRLETFLSSEATTIQSTSADGTSVTHINRKQAEDRLDRLYIQLGRANGTSPMFPRGVVTGLGRR
jgi:hypothetical protein